MLREKVGAGNWLYSSSGKVFTLTHSASSFWIHTNGTMRPENDSNCVKLSSYKPPEKFIRKDCAINTFQSTFSESKEDWARSKSAEQPRWFDDFLPDWCSLPWGPQFIKLSFSCQGGQLISSWWEQLHQPDTTGIASGFDFHSKLVSAYKHWDLHSDLITANQVRLYARTPPCQILT